MPGFKFPDGSYAEGIDPALAAEMGGTAFDPSAPDPAAAAPASMEGGVDPRSVQVDPLELESAQHKRMHDLGYVEQGGQAAREAGWVPAKREEAIDDPYYGERQNLAERERGLVRDGRDIEFEQNADMNGFLRDQEMQAEQQLRNQEMRLAEIDTGVSRERGDLDAQMEKHRELISKGVDPWRAFGGGSPSGKIAAALGLMTSTMAGPEYAAQGQQLFNSIIDREVDRQKYAIETQGREVDNAYGRLRENLGDRDQAEAALRALMLDASKTQLQAIMGQTADAQTQQLANQAILNIDKELLAANDAYYARSLGKTTEMYDQGQRGSSGGWRRMSPKEWDAWRQGRADTSNTEMGTAKIGRELTAIDSGGGDDAIIEGIDPAVKRTLGEMSKAQVSFEDFFRELGMKADPKTGQVVGEPPAEGVWGLGADKKATLGLSTQFGQGKRVSAAFNNAVYNMNRADVGANFTGGEKAMVDSFVNAVTEGDQIDLAKKLYEKIAQKRVRIAESTMSGRELDAWKRRFEATQSFNAPEAHGWSD